MTLRISLSMIAVMGLAGCSGTPSLSTGSLFGGSAPAAPPPVTNDVPARALQVAATSARATKCGFNFDPTKLRTQYLASEAMGSSDPAVAANSVQMYDASYRAVSKALAADGAGYCTPKKVAETKTALNRHLTGDYSPAPRVVEEDEDEGGGLFSSNGTPGPPKIDEDTFR